MYSIHQYIVFKGDAMKRTQLYIEEDIFQTLQEISHEQMVSISELVRKAIRKVYLKERPADADVILKKQPGYGRTGKTSLPSTNMYVK